MDAPVKRQPKLVTETHVLTAQNINEKKFLIAKNLYPETQMLTKFIPHGGVLQIFGIDYTIVEKEVTWNTLGLDNFLLAGDVISFEYYV